MTNDTTENTNAAAATTVVSPEVAAGSPSDTRRGGMRERRGGGMDRRPRRGPRREERPRSEYDNKIIQIRRVARVMAGGRRFNFSVAIVIGNKMGKVGVGLGKAGDTQLAIEKATRNAKKHMITVPMNKRKMIAHDVDAKYAASRVMIMPAKGRGLVAGSSVRTVLELAGVHDVTAKIFSRSKNQLNNARAAVKALSDLRG